MESIHWTLFLKLCKLYCANKQEDQAYALIKEEPDLFSDQRVFKSYCQILAKNNFFIEALQLKNLVGVDLSEKVKPASEEKHSRALRKL